ncbi:DUF1003 domain-containing protein [Kitasatospora cathayae]|uniref:DUF1003 domain-containing protein n=1 Tax=Kitasatospora cathayae TaxID=3004092 RepID=A0ABY7PWZ7_9ACTN|nr:DUF1003 domain-containing protein [Kitasatospora sp. HUAS 3-15]WBP84959.1 DUF1003 domain-containing protein [Kitasatospora sp. HUAS 3-15]
MREAGTGIDQPRQQPVAMADQQVGLNGAFAAALTRAVGSMPALYVALALVGGWMALATWGPLHAVDPYPFGFLLFLDNVVQLVLCLAILVGQRVLGQAADRRSVQTYENAEAIFARVADLQAHLDRHDRALGRGVSLLETSGHPWIERHRVQPPPQALDQATGVNGRIAAWLTGRLGSMWAFYLAAGTQVVWIGLSRLGLQTFDPYPFAFMSFLSTLAQLIFMIVIMVGQDVLGKAGDRRAEQTLLDAEAVLHECGRMKARLEAQGKVIESLADYTSAQVTRHLARAIHQSRLTAAVEDGEEPGSRPTLLPWEELPEELRSANRRQARQLGERLAAVGCLMVPTSEQVAPEAVGGFEDFTEEETEVLARLEHEHEHRYGTGAEPEAVLPGQRDGRAEFLPWEELSDRARARTVESVRRIPAVLADVGFQVVRIGRITDGVGELDFTPEEWAVLGRALMASGVLVALAEGVADPEEIIAIVKLLREAGTTHPRRFVRELAAASTFDTGLRPDTRYAEYREPALETIRAAARIVAERAPDELDGFRVFLLEIATVVADANEEGGILGLGARSRVPSELAAMEAVRVAGDPEAPMPERAKVSLRSRS